MRLGQCRIAHEFLVCSVVLCASSCYSPLLFSNIYSCRFFINIWLYVLSRSRLVYRGCVLLQLQKVIRVFCDIEETIPNKNNFSLLCHLSVPQIFHVRLADFVDLEESLSGGGLRPGTRRRALVRLKFPHAKMA